MPTLDQAVVAIINDEHSTHNKDVGASAARLLLKLREDFSHKEEHDLTNHEYEFVLSGRLATINLTEGPLPEWSNTYPHLSGIFNFIRAILTHPRFNPQDYQKICDNILRLVRMQKDHWSIKEYHESGVAKQLQPSMGEVINLVCHGILSDIGFEVSTQGLEVDKQDRLASLYDLFLDTPVLCSTGLSNDFLFLLDGYRGIRLVELLSGFLKESSLMFIARELSEDFKSKPDQLYQLVYEKVSSSGDGYDAWLNAKRADLEAYLKECCCDLLLYNEKCQIAIKDLLDQLEYLEISTDIHPSSISAMKYLCDDYQTKKELPVVRAAIAKVGKLLPNLKSLDMVESMGIVNFYRAISIWHECENFKSKHLLIDGDRVGQTETSVEQLTRLLTAYFYEITASSQIVESLTLPEAINQVAVQFHADVRQYEFGHLIDFVKNFFALLAHQKWVFKQQEILFKKMDVYRDRLLLTDTQIIQWLERNTNKDTGELHITPYEINQFILNALWRNPKDWSDIFRQLLGAVLKWFHDEDTQDGLKENIKSTHMNWRLLNGLELVLFMTGADVPSEASRPYLTLWNEEEALFKRFSSMSDMPGRFNLKAWGDGWSESLCEAFLKTVKKFHLNYKVLAQMASKENRFHLNQKQRGLLLNVLLDVDVLTRNSSPLDRVDDRFFSVLTVFRDDVVERTMVLDCLYQAIDGPMSPYKDQLITAFEFASLSFAEKERFLLKLPEPKTLTEIFLRRANHDPASVYYEKLTEKLNEKIRKDEINQIKQNDFKETLSALYDEEAKLEWLGLHRGRLDDFFMGFDEIVAFMRDESAKIKEFFYKTFFQGRLIEKVSGNLGLCRLFSVCDDIRETIENDVFELLERENHSNGHPWTFNVLYDVLGESGKAKLMMAWGDGQFEKKGNIQVDNFSFVLLVDLKSKKSWQEASSFLTEHPKILDVLTRYVFQSTDVSLKDELVATFLTSYFNALFNCHINCHNGQLESDNVKISTLFLLCFHFREIFYLNDSVVDDFLNQSCETGQKITGLAEVDIARFILHALHIPPHQWSLTFKTVFNTILLALKQNLASENTAKLGVPYCLSEFVYNLSGLQAVASLDMAGMAANPKTSIFNIHTEAKASYSGYDSLFYSSYAINFLVALPDSRSAYFNLIEPELSFHIRSMSDVIKLLTTMRLTSLQRDTILNIALEKAKAFNLETGDRRHNYNMDFHKVAGLTENQKSMVQAIFACLRARPAICMEDDNWVKVNGPRGPHIIYSKSICFFSKKANETPDPKSQSKTIHVSMI